MKIKNKKLLREALQLKSTDDAYLFSKKLSKKDVDELVKLSEVLTGALDIIFKEKVKWTLIFRIQFINEAIQFRQGTLKPPKNNN